MAKRFAAAKGPSQRQLRVGELVRHALSHVLSRSEVRDPALEGIVISISEVSMSPDLKNATVFVSPLGVEDAEPVIAALERNAKFIRGRISPHLNQMKYLPAIRFRVDTSFDNFARVDALLRSDRVSRDLAQPDEAGEVSENPSGSD
ncbi:MAG: 30S ribosome-binding factor RbfA [Pseudomonadota bacterium]